MITTSTTLTITVLNAQGETHYLLIKKDIEMNDILVYIRFLSSLRCNYEYKEKGVASSLTIHEPNLIALEIIVFNNTYFLELGISENDLFIKLPPAGDPVFWSIFNPEERILIQHFFSRLSKAEIGKIYIVGDKRIQARLTEMLLLIKVKYPDEKLKNRKQLIQLGIDLGVHSEERCVNCNQVL